MRFCGYSKCSAVQCIYFIYGLIHFLLIPAVASRDWRVCPVDRNGAISSLYPILCRDGVYHHLWKCFQHNHQNFPKKQGHLQFTKLFYIYFSNMISCTQHLTQYTIVQYACFYFPSLSASLSFTFFSFEDKAR